MYGQLHHVRKATTNLVDLIEVGHGARLNRQLISVNNLLRCLGHEQAELDKVNLSLAPLHGHDDVLAGWGRVVTDEALTVPLCECYDVVIGPEAGFYYHAHRLHDGAAVVLAACHNMRGVRDGNQSRLGGIEVAPTHLTVRDAADPQHPALTLEVVD